MDDGRAIFCLVGLAVLMAIALTSGIVTARWENELVQRGVALYCPNDGKFAFKDECP